MSKIKTIKLKFVKSLYPYRKWDVVDFRLDKYSDLVKKYTEEVSEKKTKEKVDEDSIVKEEKTSKTKEKEVKKKENKAILSNKNTK